MTGSALLFAIMILGVFGASVAEAQNIVGPEQARRQGIQEQPAVVELTADDLEAIIANTPDYARAAVDSCESPVVQKLNRHVQELLDNWPLMPMHFTHGISGHETYFAHADELFYALSIAWPFLRDDLQSRVRDFLRDQLSDVAPYDASSFLSQQGQPRELYDVPQSLRSMPPKKSRGGFGIYSYWAYQHYVLKSDSPGESWNVLRNRLADVGEARTSPDRPMGDLDAEALRELHGNIAGAIALCRLARSAEDTPAYDNAVAMLPSFLLARLALERDDVPITTRSQSATKSLHHFKLGRYNDLVPELGWALRQHSGGRSADVLSEYRAGHNGWYLAFGDRLIGGENYCSPPDYAHTLFTAATFVEQLDAERLEQWLDVPWCRGDLYFIEKCVYALWSRTRPIQCNVAPLHPRR